MKQFTIWIEDTDGSVRKYDTVFAISKSSARRQARLSFPVAKIVSVEELASV